MMKSVLTTKTEARERIRSLLKQYRESFEMIEAARLGLEVELDHLESLVQEPGDAGSALKEAVGALNGEQTHLVNLLKKMIEYHAKMGYLFK